jgi:hypothetical protein
MVRKPGNIRVEYATIDQFLYVHCTCRINDIFAHLGLVRENGPIIEYHSHSIEDVSERQWIKEIRDCSGYVWAVHEYFLKPHSGSISMRYQTDRRRPWKRKQCISDKGVGAGSSRDNHNSHVSLEDFKGANSHIVYKPVRYGSVS